MPSHVVCHSNLFFCPSLGQIFRIRFLHQARVFSLRHRIYFFLWCFQILSTRFYLLNFFTQVSFLPRRQVGCRALFWTDETWSNVFSNQREFQIFRHFDIEDIYRDESLQTVSLEKICSSKQQARLRHKQDSKHKIIIK